MKKDLGSIIFDFVQAPLSDDEKDDLADFIHETKKVPTEKVYQLFKNPVRSKLRTLVLKEILKTYSEDDVLVLAMAVSVHVGIPESKVLYTLKKYLGGSK